MIVLLSCFSGTMKGLRTKSELRPRFQGLVLCSGLLQFCHNWENFRTSLRLGLQRIVAAVEKFKATEQDAEICIYVRSSGTNFFPLSPNICTGQCYNPPKRTS